MEKTASLVQRVQSLVSAADKHHSSLRARREDNRQAEGRRLRKQERAKARFANRLQRREDSGIGSAVDRAAEALEQFDQRKLEEPEEVDWDEIARDLYDQTITFPECRERLLDDCLAIIEEDLASLGKVAELEIHNKRIAEVEGYYKVVIITDLTATNVKGRNHDGIVSYPFAWKDSIEGERTIGVNGSWDCHAESPQQCCDHILSTVPNPDTHGNFLQCDFSVPYGGYGNPKRDDRVIINLSPDGRVQEDPRME